MTEMTESNSTLEMKGEIMEEISIKEVIEIILKGKKVVLIITLISLVIGAVVYFVMPKKYKSTVSILANPIISTVGSANDYTNQLGFPTMDILSYEQQFLNNYTMRKTIEELDLRDNDGNYITSEEFEKRVTITNPENTNILDVEVSGENPEEVTNIANALSRYFIDYITDVYQTSAGNSAETLAERLKVEEENLDREATRLRDYLITSDSIDTLNTEISSLISQITQYKASLNDIERAIETDSITVSQLRALAGEAVVDSELRLSAILNRSTAYTGNYQMDMDVEPSELEKMLFTLKLTDIETRLIENSNSKNALVIKISELQSRLSDLQGKRAEEQYKYNTIQRDFAMAESIYETYKSQYRQALIMEASNIGNVNIKVISEAIVPNNHYNKNLLMIGGIAGALGIFIGIFAVLFKNYWDTADLPDNNSGNKSFKAYDADVIQS